MNINPEQFSQMANQIGFGGSRVIEKVVKAAEPAAQNFVEKIVEEAPKILESIIKVFVR